MKRSIIPFWIFSVFPMMGTHFSGGGHLVQCENLAGRSAFVEFFDIYETNALGRPVKIPSDGTFVDPNQRTLEIARELTARLERASPLRRQVYNEALAIFFERLSRFVDHGLSPVEDTESPLLGPGCVLLQVAVQINPVFLSDPAFLFDRALWNSLAPLGHRSALILHELIYRELRGLGHESSASARRLLQSMMANEETVLETPQSFVDNLQAAKISQTDLGGLWLEMWKPESSPGLDGEFYPHGSPKRVNAFLMRNHPLDSLLWRSHQITPRVYLVGDSSLRLFSPSGSQASAPIEIEFFENGQLASLRAIKNEPESRVQLLVGERWEGVDRVEWASDGKLEKFVISPHVAINGGNH